MRDALTRPSPATREKAAGDQGMTPDGDLLGAPSVRASATAARPGRLDASEALYHSILRTDRNHFAALHGLGVLRLRQGRLDEALRLLRKALNQSPQSAEVRGVLGRTLFLVGRLNEACAQLEKALRLNPMLIEARLDLGAALAALGRTEEAAAEYRKALAAAPDNAQVHANLGHALDSLGRKEEAAGHYATAASLRSDLAEEATQRGRSLLSFNRAREAVAEFEKAVALGGGAVAAFIGLGEALVAVGRLDEARRSFEAGLALAPGNAVLHRLLLDVKRMTPGDPQLAALEALARDPTLPEADRIEAHFALGKACADLDENDRSFSALRRANMLMRERLRYDEAATLRRFQRIAEVFTPALMRRLRGAGDQSSVPVLVVGMPRSGTSLIEQILASHPKVFGAGERKDLNAALGHLAVAKGALVPYPELVPGLNGGELRQLGGRYVEALSAAAPEARRIVDKMPGNFGYVGLVNLALPNARIIHARRDPVDTCFSCFATLFAENQPFCYDLAELGRYWVAYAALMAHWRRVLPEAVLLEVDYEVVVEDLEGQARRILAHCGLEWDPACVDFHRTQRTVRTASAAQVRRPIYRSSVGRWRRHAAQLSPLLEALGVGASGELRCESD
jgi:tetratricopeptide (TPR) repeat protein